MIDVNKLRNLAINLHGLCNVDEVYTIYYDETNNIRRLLVTPDGLNVQEPRCYVLGGIAYKGSRHRLCVDDLRSTLRIQKSTVELKLKHLGKGDFVKLLASKKISIFLKWILSEEIYLHYQVVDVLYWSVVDIVDSILTELRQSELLAYAPLLKSDLYEVLRYDLDYTVEMYSRYSYPDVGKQRRRDFIEELLSMLVTRRDLLQDINYYVLKGLLQAAAKLESLPYLENEKPNVLLDGFSEFYSNRICMFKNSVHIMDIEEIIEKRLNTLEFVDEGNPVTNYQFVDSKREVGIQVSDIVVGLLGNFFTFINNRKSKDLFTIKSNLSAIQRDALSQFREVISLSIAENPAFTMRIMSLRDECKAAFFLGF